ncbi:MAG: restriction endonuclease, partial [Thermoprotei archaeon]
MNEKIYVVKASGDKELFNKFKIISSLVRAGTPIDIAEEVADEVEEKVYNGISTREIYNICLKIL